MDISSLRQALAENLGQVLTPEVAAAIEAKTLEVNDQSIDVEQFAPLIYRQFVIKAERFCSILPELHRLHEIHWIETEKHRHGLAMNPDYEAMKQMERGGRLLQFTMRALEGDLVGNLRMYLGKSLHTQTLYASEDTLFVLPQFRGGLAALAFMRYAEKALLSLGVREIRGNGKLVNNADVLMRRMGYIPVATEFVKFFEG